MKNRWVNRNVDLATLGERIEEFFTNKGFKTAVEVVNNEYVLSAVKMVENKPASSFVRIIGKPNDFTVELAGETDRSTYLTPLITLFGGGYFMLRRLRLQGFYEELAREFWSFVEDAVEQLFSS